jgi:heme/copper-type cytochrome/quinol oxidase subunit 2
MSLNPYEAPSTSDLPHFNDDGNPRFVSGHGRAIFVMICLALYAVMAVLSLGLKAAILLLLMQVKEEGLPPANGTTYVALEQLIVVVQVGVYLTCAASFMVWLYRASRNVQALGTSGVEHSPGGAVGWWFVPFANLFKPYVVVKEIYQASKSSPDRPRRWKLKPVPAVFGWWWTFWLLGLFSNQGVSIFAKGVKTTDGFITLAWGMIFATALMFVAAILAISVVRAIDQRQRAGHEAYAK